MPHIDLIPPELVEKHKAKRIIGLIVMAGGIIAAILLVVYVITLSQVSMANARIETIKAQNTKVQSYIKTLQPYSDRKKALDERQEIIDTITEDRVLWSGIMNDISMVIPGGVWLKSVTIDIRPILAAKAEGKGDAELAPPIKIIGYARTHADVARWLVHLGEVNQFRSVWLDSATESTITGTEAPTSSAASVSGQKFIEFETTVKLAKFSDEESGK